MGYSAICKTDCILLEIEQDSFDLVQKQKIRKEKEEIKQFIINSLKKLTLYYSNFRLLENLPEIV